MHHILNKTVDSSETAIWIMTANKILNNSESRDILTARCNEQAPLHRAARAGHPEIVGRLLRKGADPNATDCFGRTAVFLAAYHGHYQVVNMLFDKMNQDGRNRIDRNDRNALHYAIQNHRDIAAVLEKKGTAAGLRRKENAVTLERKEKAAIALIDKGFDLNATDIWGGTPLWYAASEGMKMVVEHYLKQDRMRHGILILLKDMDGRWFNPEGAAGRAGHEEISKMLRDAREAKKKKKKESESRKAGNKLTLTLSCMSSCKTLSLSRLYMNKFLYSSSPVLVKKKHKYTAIVKVKA